MLLSASAFFIPASAADDTYYPELEGIEMLAMGDSYFGGSTLGKSVTWVNKLGNKYKMNYANHGIGGSTMSDFITTNNPMVTRIQKFKKISADIVLLEGGRNDRSKLVPLGDRDSRDTKTFYGAINTMIDYVLEKNPEAFIILVTAWKHSSKTSDGYSNITYADVMRDIAEYRNDPRIVCLYAADPDLTGVDMDDAKFRAKYCIKPDDVSHLNDEGMNLVLPNMEKFIAEAYINYLNYLNAPETTEEITTEPAPETTLAPVTEEVTTAAPVTEPAPAEEKGCGGFVSFSAISLIVCGACTVLFTKKKKF